MDHGAFDALTRALASGAGPRRAAMRLLSGGALAGLVARFGLEDVTAKKKHGKRHGDKKPSGQLHATGKKHNRHKKRDKKKDKDKPKEPKPEQPGECYPRCTTGKRCCPDGECVTIGSACCSNERTCDETIKVTCVQPDACCEYERECEDGSCRGLTECCPEQRECPNACLPRDACCPGEQKCADGKCYPEDGCCPEKKTCTGGVCIARDECCPLKPICDECEVAVCDRGTWTCLGNGGQCQEGCCPLGYWCHPLGSCCTDGPPFFCTCPSGYHSEAGLCVPD